MATDTERRLAKKFAEEIGNTYDIAHPEEVLEHTVKAFFGDKHKKRRKWCWRQALHAEENWWKELFR